ncbi:MAG: ATP-binding protein [Ignavibacteria bacterium]
MIAFLILLWIFSINIFSDIVKNSADKNWDEIYNEQIVRQKEIILNLFNSYQSEVNDLSEKISTSNEVIKLLQKGDQKKLFEEPLKLNLDNSYQVEIYNTRLEMITFKGRKLESDIYSLQKSLNGKKFSVLKEIGFYTYVIVYSPVYLEDRSQVSGVLLTAKLIDIKYQINNKFFQNAGLLSDINKILNVTTSIIPANNISGKINIDTSELADNIEINLFGIDSSLIGILLMPEYNKVSHIQSIDSLSHKINSVLVFVGTIILFLIFFKLISGIRLRVIKFTLFIILLAGIRYIWLEAHFPARISDWEIFSPGFYASVFGFGIAKSIGELLITSVFILAVSFYGMILIIKTKSSEIKPENSSSGALSLIVKIFLIIIFFGLIFLLGSAIQSIIMDSNLKFFDKTNIIPNIELAVIQLVVLLLCFALFIFLTSVTILILGKTVKSVVKKKGIERYSFLIFLLILFACNHFLSPLFQDFKLDYLSRILIILFSFSFGFYISLKIFLDKGYNIFSIKNFSLVMLFCIIIIPGILLEKITSQETNFIELIGKKFSEKEDERIKFLLLTELSNISENKNIETTLRNKNKVSELGFSVWAESKFSEENFNTAVVVVDTNKKILSDFIFNSQSLAADSIVKFADNNFFKKKISFKPEFDTAAAEDSLITDEESDEVIVGEGEEIENAEEVAEDSGGDDISSLYITDNILILKNENEKYYLGIVPMEKVDLKNTSFATKLGYLLVAVQYETRNFPVQSSMELFKNYSKDNLYDKLISNPIMTEYIGGEIVSSTNQDLSKSNTLSLDAFREAIKFKNNKSDWRYEIVNNEKYRTYYTLVTPQGSENERIYSISLKRNDFKLTTFFYLKFILFAVVIYLLILSVFSVILVIKNRKMRLNFREKVFASFFIVSVIPIVILALYTRSFIKNKYDINFQNQIISDLNLVSQSLKGSNLNFTSLDSLSKDQNKLLVKSLSQSDKNFNLFLKTKLASTTNEELYKSDLLDTRVDADAYYNIVYLRKDFYSKTEEIGVYSFIVGYKPLIDSRKNIAGLISSQSVYRQNEVSEELTETLTFIFGIYFIAIVILLVLVTFLTDRISKPILKLQYATEKISRGDSNVELKIERKDEIGNLMESFNKMSKELESSKDKLKKAEREAAWRDIARRVAHEVKNPLTPMKLSIQHLYDVFTNGNRNNFPEVLKKTRNIIINEIDKLNNIATEFSNFAKLSGRKYEETDLNEVIEEVISLYTSAPDIEFKKELDKNTGTVFADRQELNRVFQNLIKNSIQAIDESGVIEVKTYRNGSFIYTELIDNGSGIEPSIMKNLFEPNFSTKSTGMGLGLAITKKSIDDMKAEIIFESDLNTGTRVKIKFLPFDIKNSQPTIDA